MTPQLGSASALLLLSEYGLPQHILDQPVQSLKQFVPDEVAWALRADLTTEQEQQIEQSLAWAQAPDQYLLTIADDHYPPALLELHDPPLLLYAKGALDLLQRPGLAIVGTRNATAMGAQNAHEFAQFLSARGWCICSGLAAGIDTAAHQGALAAPEPRASTTAVLATGLDIVYPASNRALAHQIASQGLLLSEYPLGVRARPFHFPRRNRLVAALTRGVLVVEAAQRSGSLITAQLATELGREVFAIPGSIHAPLSRGCHALIKQGAKLVESGADILEELSQLPLGRPAATKSASSKQPAAGKPAPSGRPTVAKPAPPERTTAAKPALSERATAATLPAPNESGFPNQQYWATYPWLQPMGFDPLSFEQLRQLSAQSTPNLSAQLTELELSGVIVRLSDGRYQQLTPKSQPPKN